jgi:hypothetical protein
MSRYLRIARANYNRAYRELSACFGKRRVCPYEVHLRGHRFDDASRLLKLAELCLGELRHQRAIFLAPFRPGDQFRISVTMKGYDPAPRKYLVMDVEWRKGDSYTYVVHEVTKAGALHRGRHETWISPSNRILIEACMEPLDQQTASTAVNARRNTEACRADAVEHGRLDEFEDQLKRSRW